MAVSNKVPENHEELKRYGLSRYLNPKNTWSDFQFPDVPPADLDIVLAASNNSCRTNPQYAFELFMIMMESAIKKEMTRLNISLESLRDNGKITEDEYNRIKVSKEDLQMLDVFKVLTALNMKMDIEFA